MESRPTNFLLLMFSTSLEKI